MNIIGPLTFINSEFNCSRHFVLNDSLLCFFFCDLFTDKINVLTYLYFLFNQSQYTFPIKLKKKLFGHPLLEFGCRNCKEERPNCLMAGERGKSCEEKKRRNLSALWGLVSPEQIRAEKIVGLAERREDMNQSG